MEADDYEEDDFLQTQFIPPVTEPAHTNPAFSRDTETRQINRISEDTIAMLFAQKEERQQTAAEKTVEEDIVKPVSEPVYENVQKEKPEATKVIRTESKPLPKAEKSVFRSTGTKKTSNTKTVYKAPKK
jgi:hypothetical protein